MISISEVIEIKKNSGMKLMKMIWLLRMSIIFKNQMWKKQIGCIPVAAFQHQTHVKVVIHMIQIEN